MGSSASTAVTAHPNLKGTTVGTKDASIFETEPGSRGERRLDLADGGVLELFEKWMPDDDATRLFRALESEIPCAVRNIRMMGREIPQPRLTAWLGDPGARYKYSGVALDPVPWTPTLLAIRTRVAGATDHVFNACLCNLYRSGQDSVGFHADNEPELGKNPIVASVSLGVTRRFVLQHATRKELKLSLDLTHGSLLVMRGTTQAYWRHSIPKTSSAIGPRVNLTFRRIVSPT